MAREHLQMLEMCRDKGDVGGLLAARYIASSTPDRVDWTCMAQVLCSPRRPSSPQALERWRSAPSISDLQSTTELLRSRLDDKDNNADTTPELLQVAFDLLEQLLGKRPSRQLGFQRRCPCHLLSQIPSPAASSAPPFVFWHLWRQVSPWFWQPQLPQLPRARQCRQQQGCQILMNLPISTTLSSGAAISQTHSMRTQAAQLLRSRPVSVAQKAPIAWRSCLRCMHSGVIRESHLCMFAADKENWSRWTRQLGFAQ